MEFPADDFLDVARAYGYTGVTPEGVARMVAGEPLLLPPRFPEGDRNMMTVDAVTARLLNAAGVVCRDGLDAESRRVRPGDALVVTGGDHCNVYSSAYAAERLRPVTG